jgi:hypothetical protein
VGNNMPLRDMPPRVKVHAIELKPNTKAQLVRSAGGSAQLVASEGEMATLRLPSGESAHGPGTCRATIGEVGNAQHQNESLGKAGRNRWKAPPPRARVAIEPGRPPHGRRPGQDSRRRSPVSTWGQLSKGYPDAPPAARRQQHDIQRRNGRKLKAPNLTAAGKKHVTFTQERLFRRPGLWKKVQLAVETDNRKPIRTWSRRSTITPSSSGSTSRFTTGRTSCPST